MSKKVETFSRPIPQPDPYKQKATLAMVTSLEGKLIESQTKLTSDLRQTAEQLWENQKELLRGLGSAEIGLRAYQLAMDDIAREVAKLAEKIGHEPGFLKLKELRHEDGTKTAFIDWETYYQVALDELHEDSESEDDIPEGATVFE